MFKYFSKITKTITHHYTESGLPNIWVECLCTKDDAEEQTIMISNIKQLHKSISGGIVMSEGALTGPELKFLRTEMGMTPAQLGAIVHRTPSTILRWESGQCKLDAAVDTLIRILASEKLKLHKINPQEASKKSKTAVTHKARISIKAKDFENLSNHDRAVREHVVLAA